MHRLLQNILYLFVGCLCLSTGLRMVWCRDVVLYAKPLQEVSESRIDEMRPSVTYDHPWSPDAWEDDLMKHLMGMLGIGSSAWWSLNLLRHVVDDDQDVFAVF